MKWSLMPADVAVPSPCKGNLQVALYCEQTRHRMRDCSRKPEVLMVSRDDGLDAESPTLADTLQKSVKHFLWDVAGN